MSLLNQTAFRDSDGRGVGDKITMMVIQVLIDVFIILSNSLVLASVGIFKTLREKQFNHLILNLAVADLCCGIFPLPTTMSCFWYGECKFSDQLCAFSMTINMALSAISTLGVMLVSVDKYIFVMHPLRYYELVTPRRINIAIVTTWTLSFTIGIVSFMTGWNKQELTEEFAQRDIIYPPVCYVMTTEFIIFCCIYSAFIPASVTAYTGFRILSAVRSQLRKISPHNDELSFSQEEASFQPSVDNQLGTSQTLQHRNSDQCVIHNTEVIRPGDSSQKGLEIVSSGLQVSQEETKPPNQCSNHQESRTTSNNKSKTIVMENGTRKLRVSDIKAIKAMGLVIIMLFVMWAPFYSLLAISKFCSTCTLDYRRAYEIALVLGYSNSAINPILYAKTKEFRDAYKKILRCGFH
ncbi:putative G-protein coupled receptor No18 [Glandiceps talaboti]